MHILAISLFCGFCVSASVGFIKMKASYYITVINH